MIILDSLASVIGISDSKVNDINTPYSISYGEIEIIIKSISEKIRNISITYNIYNEINCF